MQEPTTELPQELVDRIISFLRDSPAHLSACALVSRSWVYPAQCYIFRRISFISTTQFVNKRLWARFLDTLDKSPHIIRHVRLLDVHQYRGQLSTRTFLAICRFPFTHLEAASVYFSSHTSLSVLAAQQLLSLPTLRRAQIVSLDTDLSGFLQLWARCSLMLSHLDLLYISGSTEGFPPTLHPPSSIRLESLRLHTMALVGWLAHPLCPFDFSGLKTLSLSENTELLDSQKFLPALQTIQTLDFRAIHSKPRLDLSSFPNLALLRIYLPQAPRETWLGVLATLSTIKASNRILKIIIVGGLIGTVSEQIDSILSNLPISLTVEFETNPFEYADMILKLPLLSSKNLLIRADHDPFWFQRLTGML